mgnify:CR=1 FL=1
MDYKWQHARGKINQADKKAIKPGAGRKTLHEELEQQVHDQAIQARREGICVTLAGIALSMRKKRAIKLVSCSIQISELN